MAKYKAIPEEFMTVGEAAKKMVLTVAANAWKKQKTINTFVGPALQVCFSRLGENLFEEVEHG